MKNNIKVGDIVLTNEGKKEKIIEIRDSATVQGLKFYVTGEGHNFFLREQIIVLEQEPEL